MNSKKNYYKTLGIKENSDKKTIKKAYKKLALKYHPDLNKSKEAEKKIKRINEAYTILSDDKKRKKYDSTRKIYEKSENTRSIVKKKNTLSKREKRHKQKNRKSNISKYINLATRLEKDYGLISGIIDLGLNSKRGHNNTTKSTASTLLNTIPHKKRKHRHRYGKNSF